MATLAFHTVDVFTDRRFGGNPLAVFPDAAGLTAAQMQQIAREFNLSETTFVLPPTAPENHAQVRIFTPAQELPFAGHPNVGTAFVLAGLRPQHTGPFRFEEAAGLVRVDLLRRADQTVSGASVAAPQPLTFGPAIDVALVAACAGVSETEIATAVHPPIVAGVGTGFVIAELRRRDALQQASPDFGAFRRAAIAHPDIGQRFHVHLYVRDPEAPAHVYTRMFAPLGGIVEDPATGSANAALAALLAHFAPAPTGEFRYTIEQGLELGRPSVLIGTGLKAADGTVRATIAGNCVPVSRGEFEV